jgi:hypothetical protein
MSVFICKHLYHLWCALIQNILANVHIHTIIQLCPLNGVKVLGLQSLTK